MFKSSSLRLVSARRLLICLMAVSVLLMNSGIQSALAQEDVSTQQIPANSVWTPTPANTEQPAQSAENTASDAPAASDVKPPEADKKLIAKKGGGGSSSSSDDTTRKRRRIALALLLCGVVATAITLPIVLSVGHGDGGNKQQQLNQLLFLQQQWRQPGPPPPPFIPPPKRKGGEEEPQ